MLVRCSALRLRAGERLRVQGVPQAPATLPAVAPGVRKGAPSRSCLPFPQTDADGPGRCGRYESREVGGLPSGDPVSSRWIPKRAPNARTQPTSGHPQASGGVPYAATLPLDEGGTPVEAMGRRLTLFLMSIHLLLLHCPSSSRFLAPLPSRFPRLSVGAGLEGRGIGKRPSEIWTQR